jgi:hypothetical protein
MAFGQQSGPPASAKQVAYLRSLVEKAGHLDFRDARGPLGLTQRQAGGKFTTAEASALIDRLLADPDSAEGSAVPDGPTGMELSARERHEDQQAGLLRGMPAGLIAGELERRGWTVTAP